MPNLTMSEGSAGFMTACLAAYHAELSAIADTIRAAARIAEFADLNREIPPDIKRDEGLAERWLRILGSADALASLESFGLPINEDDASILRAALELKREDLIWHFSRLRRDPLTPAEAYRPIEGRIRLVDEELTRLWSKFAVAPTLERLRERRAVQRGGAVWQKLMRWLAEQPPEPARTWCLCDSTFFIESQHLFSQVDWHRAWGFDRVVLVVPQAMLRELDARKGDPRKEYVTRRKKAIKALGVIDAFGEAGAPGVPSELRSGVELLVLDHERTPAIDGLDPTQPDDRLIDAALEFNENLPNERAVIVSDDRGPRFKARRYGLERRTLGEHRRPLPNTDQAFLPATDRVLARRASPHETGR